MKDITLVTGNKNKIREYNRILGITLQHVDLDLPEIQSLELEEVTAEKARRLFQPLAILLLLKIHL